jgi:hypothetical protein
MSTPIQSLISNFHNSVYLLALPNVFHKEIIIPHVCVSLTKNIIEQNSIGFPHSMYLHVGPYTPYFGSGYDGISSTPTMWPPMSNPLTNLT